jgi:hypothetical protein
VQQVTEEEGGIALHLVILLLAEWLEQMRTLEIFKFLERLT